MVSESNTGGGQPLLSICLPVYNGAEYLPNVLAALLPQADELRDLVEVIVADDASQDASELLCCAEAAADRLQYIRNCPNLGMGPNIARCITQHARGRYVWIWSQHCLLRKGKLREIVETLSQNPYIGVAYVNFRCAVYPDRWPQTCDAGFDGPYDYISSTDDINRIIPHWHLLLKPHTCLCTQTYAHIVDRLRSAEFLNRQHINRDFGPAVATFTQTTATASVFFDDAVLYFGDPVFTIFNGAQTWAKPRTRALVYFHALPELVGIFRHRGLRNGPLRDAEQYASQMAAEAAVELLKSREYGFLTSMLVRYYWGFVSQKNSISAMLGAVFLTGWCRQTRWLLALLDQFRRCWLYFAVHWRPARFVRSVLLRWQSRSLGKRR